MNKKYFWSLLTFMMVAMLSVGFASCSSDDDDDNKGGSNSSIVGTWQCEWEDDGDTGYTVLTFRANGTGHYKEYYYEGRKEILEDDEDFDWTFDEETMRLRLLFGDEIETWRVDMLTSNKMVIDGDVFVRK